MNKEAKFRYIEGAGWIVVRKKKKKTKRKKKR